MNYLDAEELALAVLGHSDDDNLDFDDIDGEIFERFDVSFESFQKIAQALIPFTIPAQAGISGKLYQGFVKDGAFIVKQDAAENKECGK